MGANGSSGGPEGAVQSEGSSTAPVATLASPPPRARLGFFGRLSRLIARYSFRVRLTVLGVAATVVIVLLDVLGLVAPIERPLYDLRARTCQFGRPTTVPFVHVDIDDATLQALGKWPWPRRVLAAAIDEMVAAGAKRVALDLIFPEKAAHDPWVLAAGFSGSGATTRPAGNDSTLATQPARTTQPSGSVFGSLDLDSGVDDVLLAQAIERSNGRVLLPLRFVFQDLTAQDEVAMAVRSALRAEPALEPEELTQRLVQRLGAHRRGEIERVMRDGFVRAREEVLLDVMLTPPRRPPEQQRAAVLGPRATTRPGVRLPIERTFEQQADKAESIWTLWSKFPREVEDSGDLLVTRSEDGPVATLARGAGGYGFVDYINDDDGVVRSVPLVVNHRGHLAPQFALSLACLELGVRPDSKEDIEIHDDRIVLRPAGGRERVIPVFTAMQRHGRARVGASFAIPFWGGRDWQAMFSETAGGGAVAHVPFTLISQILEMTYNRDENRRRTFDDLNILRAIARPKLQPVVLAGEDYEARIEETFHNLERRIKAMKAAEPNISGMLPDEAADLADRLRRLRHCEMALAENRKIVPELTEARRRLRDAVGGKVVFVGWAATAAAADFVPTPIHDKCAGVVLHGAVYNAIMTGASLRMAPAWLTPLLTMMLGLASVWVMVQAAPREGEETGGPPPPPRGRFGRFSGATQTQLSPTQATVLGVTLVVLWVLVNAVVLFGWRHYVVGLAAPLVAMLLVWSLGIAAIAAERFRVTQILRGYVDPKLVEYLKRNPEEALFRTRVQEVTVCFSDIQGFTSLTQLLGERMVPMLQDYLSRMVQVIRRNNGVVNKFMGDGIMYIFGVPEAGKENHAERALRCCLEMQEALVQFNRERMVPNGFPTLKMRCGVNTGIGYCGDAGPAEAREYTALGDTTNVAARLEPANKDVGTLILVADSTRRSVSGETFFFRPVGKLKLRNRAGCVETHELVGLGSAASPKDFDHARLLEIMIRSFQSRMFDECLGFVNAVCAEFGDSKLCDLYRRQCEELSRNGAANDEAFEGQVIGG